jgi:hypothetical protein
VNQPIATGKVEWLGVNGSSVSTLNFCCQGPSGDSHAHFTRSLSGHDGAYLRTSNLKRGDKVFNWRTWTALSSEEVRAIEEVLQSEIPRGCLLENIVISGVPAFSKLAPTTRFVFPHRFTWGAHKNQAILAVWGENGPCKMVGERLERHHQKPGLQTDFVAAAQDRRGVMGFVLAAGQVNVGDEVLVYPPVR